MKRELRKRRLEESRRKQKETKERRERERLRARPRRGRSARARSCSSWAGACPGGLSERTPDEAKLARQGLPVLATPEALAQAMGLSVGQLRALCFTRTASTTSNYVRFQLPKKTGGTRLISAPLPRLKAAQALGAGERAGEGAGARRGPRLPRGRAPSSPTPGPTWARAWW